MGKQIDLLLATRGAHALTAIPLGPLPAYLAVDLMGHPALAVPAVSGGVYQMLETDYLSLSLFSSATVTELNGTQTHGLYHLLTCNKGGREVNVPFEALVTGLAESLTTVERAHDELCLAFETLCELFRMKPASDLTRARIGLWGELCFMREAPGYKKMAPFWHTDPGRKFDFSCRQFRLELKATTSADRSHTFAHGQLYSSGDTEIVVGSLVLRYEDAGLSLATMITEARAALAADVASILKLEAAVRAAGMADTPEEGPKFDLAEAQSLLHFYRAEDVPHFAQPEPPGVFGTTYSVSLGALAPIPSAEFATWLAQWQQE